MEAMSNSKLWQLNLDLKSASEDACLGAICGFHVTQVSLIIMQVKNKIAYHLINWVKKLKNRRGVNK